MNRHYAMRQPESAWLNSLQSLLQHCALTKFGQYNKLRSNMTLAEFRSTVPIRGYLDYEPWIERILAGEDNVLWPGRPISFVTTSGTTAAAKVIPISEPFLDSYHFGNILTVEGLLRPLWSYLLRNGVPRAEFPLGSLWQGFASGKVLVLGGPSEEYKCSGVPVGSITGVLFASLPAFLARRLAVPPAAQNIRSYDEKLYTIVRLAMEEPVVGLAAVEPGSLVVLADAIASLGCEIVDEIERGFIRNIATGPEGFLQTVRASRRPNPARAQQLRSILATHGSLSPASIWPIRAVVTFVGHGHPLQWQSIRHSYGKVFFMDPGLVASEGRVSVGYLPNSGLQMVLPTSNFVEFLPSDVVESSLPILPHAPTLLPHELKVGNTYAPVVSSANGLLRYVTGDSVKVCELSHGIPIIEFAGRLDSALSAAGEKISEAQFREAVCRLRRLDHRVDGGWCAAITWRSDRPSYLFVWETNGDRVQQHISNDLDLILKDINISYKRKRDQRLLLPPETVCVREGVLRSRTTKALWLGQSKSQQLFMDENELYRSLRGG